VGKFGGLLAAWYPNLFDLVIYITVGGILLTSRSLLNNQETTMLNIYGPCSDHKTFWNSVEDNDILSIKNLIMEWDFNIILSSEEAWGGSHDGIIDDYYTDLFSSKNLIDIKPTKLVPTWRNGRFGHGVISRILDKVLVSEDILTDVSIYRSSVEFPFISDHAPILLQLELSLTYKIYPFKFNAQWLNDKEFADIVLRFGKTLFIFPKGENKRGSFGSYKN